MGLGMYGMHDTAMKACEDVSSLSVSRKIRDMLMESEHADHGMWGVAARVLTRIV